MEVLRAEGFLTKHSEVGLAHGASSCKPVNPAEELPLVRKLDVLDGEFKSPVVWSPLDASAVVCVVVHHLLIWISVEDPRP